ncbi:unnamed protein product [Amoebophrya sp. A25]|nr:unnamed protein product [Amoebophrya sp. A25]|eukprot:GSA25T00026780001.1
MRSSFTFLLYWLSTVGDVSGWHLEIVITSAWRSVERRNILRDALSVCAQQAHGHKVSYHFFLGNVNTTLPADEEKDRILYANGRFFPTTGDEEVEAVVVDPVKNLGMIEEESPLLVDPSVAAVDQARIGAVVDPIITDSDDALDLCGATQGQQEDDNNDKCIPGSSTTAGQLQGQLTVQTEPRRDMVLLNAPDLDPPVMRDVTYILDRPTSRAFRVAYGTKWVHHFMPTVDFVFYLDDDSFLNVPRLFQLLESVSLNDQRDMQRRHEDKDALLDLRYRNERGKMESLVMGYMMETEVDMGKFDICEMCQPCERCTNDVQLREFCGQVPHMTLGGCLAYMNTCKIYESEEPLIDCVRRSQDEAARLGDYFGTKKSPLWVLGMGWLFGRRIISYIARNAADLKKRGAADLILGYWLVGLEDLHWVDTGPLGNFRFHDYPMHGNTFTRNCHSETILVHRMTPERWANDFERDTCLLDCKLEEEENKGKAFMDETVRELQANPTGVKTEARVRRGSSVADQPDLLEEEAHHEFESTVNDEESSTDGESTDHGRRSSSTSTSEELPMDGSRRSSSTSTSEEREHSSIDMPAQDEKEQEQHDTGHPNKDQQQHAANDDQEEFEMNNLRMNLDLDSEFASYPVPGQTTSGIKVEF